MIQLLSKSSNGTDPAHYRESYRARLRELADPTSDSSDAPEGMPLDEASCDETLTAAPPDPKPTDGFAAVATKIASSLTECWSGALAEVDRRAAMDRSRLQAAVEAIESLADKARNLSDRVASLSEHEEVVDRNFHDLSGRLFHAEERLEAQATATASLEQTVSSQVEVTESRIVPTLTRISDGLETFTKVLDAHTGAIENLNAAWSKSDAAQRSILERLERQAQAIQSVHAAMEAQSERWGALKQAAAAFANRLDVPAESVSPPEKL